MRRIDPAHRRARGLGVSRRAATVAILLALHLTAGGLCRGAAATPLDAGRVAAVSFFRRQRVALLDTATGQPAGWLRAGRAPRGLAMALQGDWLYLTERSRLERLALPDGQTGDTFNVSGAMRIVAAPDASRVYISRLRPTAVAAVTLSSAAAIDWTTRLPARVLAMALDPHAPLLAVTYGRQPGHLAVLDTATGAIRRTVNLDGSPIAVAVTNSSDTAFVLSARTGALRAVWLVDGSRHAPVHLGGHPHAIAISPDDARLYLADPDTRSVLLVERSTLTVQRTLRLPGRPWELAVSGDGTRLLVTSPRARSVFVVDTRTFELIHTEKFAQQPWRVVFGVRGGGMPSPPTPVVTLRPTPTPIAPSTPPATPTGGAADLATATPTRSPTLRSTATPSPTPASTPTATPMPPGVVLGDVFDDGTAQPLDGVDAALVGTTPATRTHADGRYTVVAPAGDPTIELGRTGYTRSLRLVSVSPRGTTRARDARLTALAAPTLIGETGGVVTAAYHQPRTGEAGPRTVGSARPLPVGSLCGTVARLASAATSSQSRASGTQTSRDVTQIEMHIPPAAVPDGTQVRMTPLSPQGLIAPVPTGWSVLLGVDLQASTVPSTAATLRVPLALLASTPITVAIWDDGAQQWRAGPAASADGEQLDVVLERLEPGLCVWGSQLALLIADTTPVAPPVPIPGAPLAAPGPLWQPTPSSAGVLADPAVIVAGGDATAYVVTSLHDLGARASGSVFETRVHEHYDLRSGEQREGLSTRQELIGYQVTAPSLATGTSQTLGAYFTVKPSHPYPVAELRQGRITIDLFPSPPPATLGAVDPAGGDVGPPDGPHLVVPAGAVDRVTGVCVSAVSADDLPAGTADRSDFLGALHFEAFGSPLNPDATYRFTFSAWPSATDHCIVARLITLGGRTLFDFVALGERQGNQVRFNPCADGRCYESLTSGTYVVFARDDAPARVTGVVRDHTGSRSGIAVESNRAPVESVSDSSGHYLLPASVGVLSTITAHEPVHNLTATVSITPAAAALETRDLPLQGTPPQVTQIQPNNHAVQVAPDSRIVVTFSQPMDAASLLAAGAVNLVRVVPATAGTVASQAVVFGHLSVSTDAQQVVLTPSAALEANSVYRLRLASSITDQNGTSLLSPRSAGGNQDGGSSALGDALGDAFSSDFTTAAVLHAEALPPNTLHVSLPDGSGTVVVCGGAQLAAPGTFVVVTGRGPAHTVYATLRDEDRQVICTIDPNDPRCQTQCPPAYAGRCDTTAPGSFCAVIEAAIGDRIQVQVEDVLHDAITLDAGNMRDDITGEEVIGPEGGVVSFPADPRYQAFIPDGAFTEPTAVRLTPIEMDPTTAGILDLNDPDHQHPDFAALTTPAVAQHFDLVGAVRVTLNPPDRRAQRNFDVSVPAPPDVTAADQFLAAQVVSFRSDANGDPRDELTAVDTAQFDPSNQLVVTDPGPFEGLTIGGTFGLLRAKECLAYLIGWTSTGDHVAPGGYVGSALYAPLLPFALQSSSTSRFKVPVPCNTPAQVELHDIDDQVIDQGCGCTAGGSAAQAPANSYGEPCILDKGATGVSQCVLSPTHQTPSVLQTSSSDGANDVDPLAPLQVTLDVAAGPSSTVQLTDHRGTVVRGTVTTSGATLTFAPEVRLKYGERYTFQIGGVTSATGDPLPPSVISFSTSQPVVLQHIDNIDARDVVWLDPRAFPPNAGVSPCTDLIAVAEGDLDSNGQPSAAHPDWAGGVRLFDVSDLSTAPAVVARGTTAGVDRALTFTKGPLTTLLKTPGQPDQPGPSFDGPFLMSVDGPGGPDRFGAWRLWDLSSFAAADPNDPDRTPRLKLAASRLISLSPNALARLSGTDTFVGAPTGYTELSQLFGVIPHDQGIPEDIASFGVDAVYVANAPFIGLQVITPPQMDVRPGVGAQVQGTLHDTSDPTKTVPIRAVATLPNSIDPNQSLVVAVAEEFGVNKLILTDAQLATVYADEQVETANAPTGRPTAVAAWHDWPLRPDPTKATTMSRDVVAVMCDGSAVCVIPVRGALGPQPPAFDLDGTIFSPGLSPGIGRIAMPGGSPRGMAFDPQTQLLFVANGTAGLAIIDLAVPGGSRDDDHDGVDDRVLGTVDLGGARAERVAVWRDAVGGVVAGVTTGTGGVYLLRVTPSDPVALASLNKSSATCATVSVIDAQFEPYRKQFTALEHAKEQNPQRPVPSDLIQTLVNEVPRLDDTATRGMNGAAADGLSRLVLRANLSASDPPLTQVQFVLENTATPVSSHHDTQFPIGFLSADGLSNPTTTLTVTTQQDRTGQLVAVAVYTPPTFFPYQDAPVQLAAIDFAVTVKDGTGKTLSQVPLRLVRPPVMVLHGLFGSRERAVGEKFKLALSGEALWMSFPDFSERNISGFDRVFDVIPKYLNRVRNVFRDKNHPERHCTSSDKCLLQGNQPPIARKKIALTKIDAVAHSMGGVLIRWYTTDQLWQDDPRPIPSDTPRAIHYPSSSGLSTLSAGAGYFDLETSRDEAAHYRRPDNFMQGDLGSAIVYGSPLRGSPLANGVTHDRCHDERTCYLLAPQNPGELLVDLAVAFLGKLSGIDQPDVGTAIYDLSIGSTVYEAFHRLGSEPVRVHAIGTTADSDGAPVALASYVTSASLYCPGFNETNSDRIVPLGSQFANIGHRTPASGAWHQNQDQSKDVQSMIIRLLIDGKLASAAGTDLGLHFDAQFSADPMFPLECGTQ